jgi:uncharacterized protein (DUF4415 family)
MLDRPRGTPDGDEPRLDDVDNPEWTEADFARARRGDAIPEAIRAALTRGGPGRPVADPPVEVTLQLPPQVVAHFQSHGADWRERMGAALLAQMLAELRGG